MGILLVVTVFNISNLFCDCFCALAELGLQEVLIQVRCTRVSMLHCSFMHLFVNFSPIVMRFNRWTVFHCVLQNCNVFLFLYNNFYLTFRISNGVCKVLGEFEWIGHSSPNFTPSTCLFIEPMWLRVQRSACVGIRISRSVASAQLKMLLKISHCACHILI